MVDSWDLSSDTETLDFMLAFGGRAPLSRIISLGRRAEAKKATLGEDVPNAISAEWKRDIAFLTGRVEAKMARPRAELSPASAAELDKNIKFLAEAAGPLRRLTFINAAGEAVWEAFIRPDNSVFAADVSRPSDRPDRSFHTIADTHVPFSEQDRSTGACAHAAVREIIFATRGQTVGCGDMNVRLEHPDPGQGLDDRQISKLFAEYNVMCEAYEWDDTFRTMSRLYERGMVQITDERYRRADALPDELIYRYVEAGLPVIGVISPFSSDGAVAHSLSFLGHTFNRDRWWPTARPRYFPTLATGRIWMPSSMWNSSFLVHDDLLGPYLNIPPTIVRDHVAWALALVPKEIELRVKPEDAEDRAVAWLLETGIRPHLKRSAEYGNRLATAIMEAQDSKTAPLVLRPILMTREDFLAQIDDSECGYSAETKQAYRLVDENGRLSPWMWVVEISTPSLYGNEMWKLGELLIDTRLGPNDAGTIAWHLPGVFMAPILMDLDPEQPLGFADDGPSCLFRGSHPNWGE